MANRAESFRTTVLGKVDKLLSEFAQGKVSREQFHAIYEHYNTQLAMIDQLDNPEMQDVENIASGATIAIRHAHMGKALGLVIYHNKRGVFVDTLGEFDVASSLLSPTLNDFSSLMAAGQLIDRRVIKVPDNRWLLFAAGRFTSVIALFHHEPAPLQIRELERLHHDFEMANETALSGTNAIDNNTLGYPFLVLLQKKLKKS